MSNTAKLIWGFLGLIAILISVFVVRTYSAAGQFTSLPKYGTQSCRPLVNIVGVEDIAIDRESGVAFISSLDRRSAQTRGDIFSLDLNSENPEKSLKQLTPGVPEIFSPLGLAYFKSDTGDKRLFVINRARGRAPHVEIFSIEDAKLKHLKSVTSPMFQTPNNLTAVDLDNFYLTNDGLKDAGFIQSFIDFANQKKKGNVVYFDGSVAREVASGFVSANGISTSRDGKNVYVTDMHSRILKFFSRAKNNDLTEIGDLFVGTGLDNIDVDEEGHLWIAAHPKLFDHYRLSGSSKRISPSQVIEAVPGAKEGGKMRTVFLDKGERLSGSSIGLRYKNRLLISGAFENKILVCDIPVWKKQEKK